MIPMDPMTKCFGGSMIPVDPATKYDKSFDILNKHGPDSFSCQYFTQKWFGYQKGKENHIICFELTVPHYKIDVMKIYDLSGSHEKLVGQICDPSGSLDKTEGYIYDLL